MLINSWLPFTILFRFLLLALLNNYVFFSRRARETVKVARARVFAFSAQTSKGLGATHLVFIEIFGRLATGQIFVYVKFGGQS